MGSGLVKFDGVFCLQIANNRIHDDITNTAAIFFFYHRNPAEFRFLVSLSLILLQFRHAIHQNDQQFMLYRIQNKNTHYFHEASSNGRILDYLLNKSPISPKSRKIEAKCMENIRRGGIWMGQKIFVQIHFRLFRRTLAPTRLQDHEFAVIFLHTLWHCRLNVKILNNPDWEDIWWTISINKYVQLPAKMRSHVRSRSAECEQRCPNVAGDTRMSAESTETNSFLHDLLDGGFTKVND